MPTCKSCGEDALQTTRGVRRRCYHREYMRKYRAAHHETIVCKVCGKERMHASHGMCVVCYKQWWRGSININGQPTPNKSCSIFLGVHVAEHILSKVFKNVQSMPYGTEGYDFICNNGKKIDVKSACTVIHDKKSGNWGFHINRNSIADFFLCLAFDNRKDLNPLHIWLIPGHIINHLTKTSISESTLSKWNEYKLDIGKVVTCCDTIKQSIARK